MKLRVGQVTAKADRMLGGLSESIGVELDVQNRPATRGETIAALAVATCLTVASLGSGVLSFKPVGALAEALTPEPTMDQPVHGATCAEIGRQVLHKYSGWDDFAMTLIDDPSTARGFSRNLSSSISNHHTAFVCTLPDGSLVGRSPISIDASNRVAYTNLGDVISNG
ncbi:MAG: hypothetical protein AAF413_04295 [Patescibacteria group bacterium]